MVDEIAHSNIYHISPSSSVEARPQAQPADVAPSGRSSLGNIAKSYSADIDESQKARSYRTRRFALKSVVHDILPNSRTAKCLRWRAPDKQVEVWRRVTGGVVGEAYLTGLMVCGLLWTCPVCAAKISQRRRPEIRDAIDNAKAQGLRVLFLTQTIRHGFDMPLSYSLDAFAAADKLLWSSRSGALMREQYGIVGTIKILETTWGEANGWHPHKHALLFVSGDSPISQIQADLSYRWINACVKKGLPAPGLGRAITVQDGSFADAYVSKWGLEDEMTKSHCKVAKTEGRMTPFALLQDVLDTGDARSWSLFKEYAEAFKGKRQLVWSKGLRDMLLPEQPLRSDEELAAELSPNKEDLWLSKLSIQEWRAIKYFNYDAIIRDKAEDCRTPENFQLWLDSVTDSYRHAKSDFSIPDLNIDN